MDYKVKTVEWRDSLMYVTQCSIEDGFDIGRLTSVGYVIQEDDEKIVLAGDIVGEDARRVISIPKENIIKIN